MKHFTFRAISVSVATSLLVAVCTSNVSAIASTPNDNDVITPRLSNVMNEMTDNVADKIPVQIQLKDTVDYDDVESQAMNIANISAQELEYIFSEKFAELADTNPAQMTELENKYETYREARIDGICEQITDINQPFLDKYNLKAESVSLSLPARKAIKTAPCMKPEDLNDKYIEENATRLLSELNACGNTERKHTFISCWHCNEHESEAMWKLYSTNVKNAIAIQTTYQQLYEALDKDPQIEIGKVKYIDFSKSFSSINGAFWYKRKSFEHEREVRAIVKSQQAHSGIEKAVDLEKLISAVYISPYAPKWFEDVVRDVMEKYKLNKPLYYSEMLKTPFY
ncbi:hypothetical protein [Ruminococcus flavefaciens]|uniref:hypothetical protein n=1 Tax=Ruminococcus flavefaciens TaxID=1265 RepID=UPI0013DD31E3|nr:hypothetical protein [Ruminococcus flavefaciens]